MMRPRLVTASVIGGELVLFADGVPFLAMSPRLGLWLIQRIASALAIPSAPDPAPTDQPRVPRFPG